MIGRLFIVNTIRCRLGKMIFTDNEIFILVCDEKESGECRESNIHYVNIQVF